MYIFLDDERTPDQVTWLKLPKLPPKQEWVIVRTYEEFLETVEGLKTPPVHISFDHDLGHQPEDGERERTGYSCACALGCIAQDNRWLHLPKCTVHSQNPVGKKNIEAALDCAAKYLGRGIGFA